MIKKLITLFWIFIFIFSLPLAASSEEKVVVGEEKDIHKVDKGDTLWDISKKYKKDPFSWTKIWKLNPSITNPHLIFPGQVIILEERILVKTPEPEKAPEPEVPVVEKVPTFNYPHVLSAGFILPEKPSVYSTIVSSHREALNFNKGHKIFIDKRRNLPLDIGVSYLVVDTNKVIVHPETEEEIGFLYHVKGVVRVEAIHNNSAEALITDSFDTIEVGDPVIPFRTFSEQIVLKGNNKKIKGVVLGGKPFNLGISGDYFAQHQVIYIDKGLKDGVEVGDSYKVIIEPDKIDRAFLNKGGTIPYDYFAEILIIIAEDNFSTALITKTKKDVHRGYAVR